MQNTKETSVKLNSWSNIKWNKILRIFYKFQIPLRKNGNLRWSIPMSRKSQMICSWSSHNGHLYIQRTPPYNGQILESQNSRSDKHPLYSRHLSKRTIELAPMVCVMWRFNCIPTLFFLEEPVKSIWSWPFLNIPVFSSWNILKLFLLVQWLGSLFCYMPDLSTLPV